jgi:hypothetical protein
MCQFNELRPLFFSTPWISSNVAIIAPRDEARSQDDDRFNLASNELRSSFL